MSALAVKCFKEGLVKSRVHKIEHQEMGVIFRSRDRGIRYHRENGNGDTSTRKCGGTKSLTSSHIV